MIGSRKLSATSLEVADLALGTGSFGTRIASARAHDILDQYRAVGGNFIDTANIYGRRAEGGEPASERVVGEWLQRQVREDLVVGTKGGAPRNDAAAAGWLSPNQIVTDLEDSLRNLKTDYVDLYWLHRDNVDYPVADVVDTLTHLRSTGKIRYFGVANWGHERLRQALGLLSDEKPCPLVAIQKMWNLAVPNHSVLDAQGMKCVDDEDLKLVAEYGLGVAAYSPQAQGYFSLRRGNDFEQSDRYRSVRSMFDGPESRERAHIVWAIADRRDADPTEVVLAALLSLAPNTWPIVGPSTVEELRSSVSACCLALTDSELAELAPLLSSSVDGR